MASDYIRLVENRARQRLETLTQEQQQKIYQVYKSAGRNLAAGYTQAKSGTATKALYASYTQKIAEETEQIIKEYAIKFGDLPIQVESLIMNEAFLRAGLDTSLAGDTFKNLVGKLGMESAKNVIGGGIYQDGVGLSARVWQSSAMASNRIQAVVAAGLAQDMSAVKLSKMLQDYVNPTARKTWSNDKIREILGDGYAAWNKNLEYNALRLARTTLAHTATMSMRQAKKVNPYATKIRWHSVHAGGRTCPTCEEMDGQLFDTDKCPFDHPNGMCYQTHEMEKSLDEIADELAAWCKGEPNEVLDNWWAQTGGETTEAAKMNFLHRLITRDELKKMSESHVCNQAPMSDEYRRIAREMRMNGELTEADMEIVHDAYTKIYNDYVGTATSWDINAYLRQLPDGADIDRYSNTIKALDLAIDKFQFAEDVKLRRFVAGDYLSGTFGGEKVDDIAMHIGGVFKNKQYLSTTIDSNPCFDNRPAVMTILCDKGTHAFPTINYDEGEVVLSRNTEYELIDVIDHSGDNPMTLEYESWGGMREFKYRGIELIVKISTDGLRK